MINTKHLRRAGLLAALGTSVAAALSGCGGASTNSGNAAPLATPVAYGVTPINNNVGFGGVAGSGLESADGTTGYITGALSTTATILASEGGFTTGFAFGPVSADNTTLQVAAPAGPTSVIFRADLANGNNGGAVGPIVPSSVVLTSPEVPSFTQPLTFNSALIGVGPDGNAQYVSAAFPSPFTTSGIHQFAVSVADTGGQSSSTTFGVVVLAATDVALVLQNFDTGMPDPTSTTTPPADIINAIAPGDTVTIDGGQGTGVYPAKFPATTADTQGTVVLFTKPGTHTVVETDPTGKVVNTSTFTIAATGAGTTIYTVPAPGTTVPAPATKTGSVARPHLVKRH